MAKEKKPTRKPNAAFMSRFNRMKFWEKLSATSRCRARK